MATLQGKGLVKDIQAHLRHAKADTTANESMQELQESVGRMVEVDVRGVNAQSSCGVCRFATKCYQRGWEPYLYLYERYGRHEETRTPELYRVKVQLFNTSNYFRVHRETAKPL
jgi:hypothetical protein